jgi:PAS domain S-box-containing protein
MSLSKTDVVPFGDELFGALVEESLVGTFVVENEQIVYANARASEIFGRPVAELLGLRLDQVVHPDDRREGNQRLRERADGGAPSSPYSIRALRPDGTILELETQSALRTIEGRRVVVISILDFTERNRTQRVLNQMAEAVGTKVGQEFFSSLVLNLSRTLGVDYAFVAEIGDDGAMLHMIAVAIDGRIAEPIAYAMVETPCERVVGSALCWFPSRIQSLFPNDHLLGEMQAEAYAGVPLLDSSGRPLGLVAILHRSELARERAGEAALEIYAVRAAAELERRRGERALLAAKAYVDNILETAPVMFLELDRDGAVTRVNHAVEEVTGMPRQQLLGRAAASLFPGVRLTEAPVVAESFVRRGGEERLVGWRTGEVRDVAGNVTGTLVFAADVTEQRRLQRDVQRSAAEWKETFDNVNTPIFVTDAAGVVLRANLTACSLASIDAERLPGTRVDALGAGEPWQTAMQLVRHVSQSRGGNSAETKDSDDRTWDLTVAHFAAEADDAPRFILVLWDISGIVELQESLSRTAKMTAMGSLVAGVAHEVRNPLFGISATLDAYAEELSRPGYEECAGALRTEVVRMTRLMQELLEYGKPAAMQVERGQIGGVIEEAVSGRAHRDAGVQVLNTATAPLPELLMDRSRMRQVFDNLIDNAVRLSVTGGRVTVAADVAEHAGRRWLECRVEDSGPGFSGEDLEHVFEPFFSRRAGGTGLGLSIVQRIVEEHSGKVIAANRPGGGAVVTVRLPVAERT